MAFGGFSRHQTNQPMAEINMIPLIDVMLVLLVIFIIAAPLMTHAVKIELPKADSTAEDSKPEVIRLSIDASGNVYWNEQVTDQALWLKNLAQSASHQPLPELLIRADGSVDYRRVAEVMSDAAKAGLTRIAFVTEPHQP